MPLCVCVCVLLVSSVLPPLAPSIAFRLILFSCSWRLLFVFIAFIRKLARGTEKIIAEHKNKKKWRRRRRRSRRGRGIDEETEAGIHKTVENPRKQQKQKERGERERDRKKTKTRKKKKITEFASVWRWKGGARARLGTDDMRVTRSAGLGKLLKIVVWGAIWATRCALIKSDYRHARLSRCRPYHTTAYHTIPHHTIPYVC